MLRGLLLTLGLGLCLGTNAARALTVEEVIGLLDAGVGEPVILDQIAADGARFELSARDILSLKEAGATDELLRALIRAGRGAAGPSVSGSRGAIRDDRDDLEARYASPGVRVRLYYDPFGYHWYAWPWAYAYYDPFPWFDCGFYYAGWWDCRWWRRGSWCVGHGARYCGYGPGRWHRDRHRSDDRRDAWSRGDRDGRPAGPRGGLAWGPPGRSRARNPRDLKPGTGRDRPGSSRALSRPTSTRPPSVGWSNWRSPAGSGGPGRSFVPGVPAAADQRGCSSPSRGGWSRQGAAPRRDRSFG